MQIKNVTIADEILDIATISADKVCIKLPVENISKIVQTLNNQPLTDTDLDGIRESSYGEVLELQDLKFEWETIKNYTVNIAVELQEGKYILLIDITG